MKVPKGGDQLRRGLQAQLRRRDGHGPTEAADDRVTRGFGPPALAAIGVSSLGAAIFFSLGVVSDKALGMTPVVYLVAGLFFVLTAMTYIEGTRSTPSAAARRRSPVMRSTSS
jgi:hypothetical protein